MIKEYDARPSKELLDRINKVMKETEDEHETAGGVLKELLSWKTVSLKNWLIIE